MGMDQIDSTHTPFQPNNGAVSISSTTSARGGPSRFSNKVFALRCTASQAEPDGSHLRPGSRSEKPERRHAIEAMAVIGRSSVTTGDSLSATWRLLWTTEKEQLFIIEKAGLFGTRAGEVLQVIDVRKGTLNNVITFPPDGVFFVRSDIDISSPQRVNFRFTSAVLRGSNWEVPLPPFGQGWFENVYMDGDIRVAKDIRGDYLVVDRAPFNWNE